MKHKLLPIFYILCITIVCFICIYDKYNLTPQEELSLKLLRFHVIANSNSSVDQYIKLKVKEAVVSAMQPYMSRCTSKAESIEVAKENISFIQEVATNTLNRYHVNQSVSICIENTYFPIKTYGDFTFPSGYYDSVRIVLGEGKGENWWCVLYPPLCFVDMSYGVVPESSKETLSSTLSKHTYNSLSEDKTKFGFRFFPFLNWLLE